MAGMSKVRNGVNFGSLLKTLSMEKTHLFSDIRMTHIPVRVSCSMCYYKYYLSNVSHVYMHYSTQSHDSMSAVPVFIVHFSNVFHHELYLRRYIRLK